MPEDMDPGSRRWRGSPGMTAESNVLRGRGAMLKRAGNSAVIPRTEALFAATPAVGERFAHGVDRNCRDETRGKEPGETDYDRKCARQRLPRDEITVTNREAGNESEIDRIPERPALNKTSQQAQGKLKRQNCRQHRPRHVKGMAERHEKALPHLLRRPPVHAMATSVNGELAPHKRCNSATDRDKGSAQESSNQNKARHVKGKKISHLANRGFQSATTWRPG